MRKTSLFHLTSTYLVALHEQQRTNEADALQRTQQLLGEIQDRVRAYCPPIHTRPIHHPALD